MSWQERTEMLLGSDALKRLSQSRVLVVGLGGVGAYAAEMLARSGVGEMVLVDSDVVGESNRNRQLVALSSTVGRLKCDVLKERLMDINPEIRITTIQEYVCEDNVAELVLSAGRPDVVVDAIDTLSPKIALIQFCLKENLRLVSSMGAGAKKDATKLHVDDISRTFQCPLAHMLRKRLHKLGIREGFKAVFSSEQPVRESVTLEESRNKKSQVGTISYMPAVFGCVCAQAAIAELIGA
ncbi:MAG: tRNA threonylcarbamoyladenosine dehydratase [Bacteroidales bacterium]|nr:tRNA threonylcarbamoyladenosine dehydratase [Bacteroidales bacterium]